jgi:hypothetical protein
VDCGRGILVGPAGGHRLGLAPKAVELVPLPLPGGDEHLIRVGRIHHHFDDPGLVVHLRQDVLPRLPAVLALEQPTLSTRPVQPAQGPDEHSVRFGRVDDDLADLVRALQAHVLPSLAAVSGLVDPVAE